MAYDRGSQLRKNFIQTNSTYSKPTRERDMNRRERNERYDMSCDRKIIEIREEKVSENDMEEKVCVSISKLHS